MRHPLSTTYRRFERAGSGSLLARGSRHPLSAAVIIATAAMALLGAACSTSQSFGGSPDAGGSTSSPSAVAYSACIRSHGVPNYPDPTSGGGIPKGSAQQFGVSSSQLRAAQRACQHLYPGNAGSFHQSFQQCEMTGDCPQALVQHALNLMRKFAECMRSHGVPNWPDPATDSQGRPFFDVSGAGISHAYTHSPPVVAKVNQCSSQVGGPGGVPVPEG